MVKDDTLVLNHITRLLINCVKSNMLSELRERDKNYYEGKKRAYQTVLGWVDDMRAGRSLMSDESTLVSDELFLKKYLKSKSIRK
jgi:hypothetical protein